MPKSEENNKKVEVDPQTVKEALAELGFNDLEGHYSNPKNFRELCSRWKENTGNSHVLEQLEKIIIKKLGEILDPMEFMEKWDTLICYKNYPRSTLSNDFLKSKERIREELGKNFKKIIAGKQFETLVCLHNKKSSDLLSGESKPWEILRSEIEKVIMKDKLPEVKNIQEYNKYRYYIRDENCEKFDKAFLKFIPKFDPKEILDELILLHEGKYASAEDTAIGFTLKEVIKNRIYQIIDTISDLSILGYVIEETEIHYRFNREKNTFKERAEKRIREVLTEITDFSQFDEIEEKTVLLEEFIMKAKIKFLFQNNEVVETIHDLYKLIEYYSETSQTKYPKLTEILEKRIRKILIPFTYPELTKCWRFARGSHPLSKIIEEFMGESVKNSTPFNLIDYAKISELRYIYIIQKEMEMALKKVSNLDLIMEYHKKLFENPCGEKDHLERSLKKRGNQIIDETDDLLSLSKYSIKGKKVFLETIKLKIREILSKISKEEIPENFLEALKIKNLPQEIKDILREKALEVTT